MHGVGLADLPSHPPTLVLMQVCWAAHRAHEFFREVWHASPTSRLGCQQATKGSMTRASKALHAPVTRPVTMDRGGHRLL